MVGWLAVWLAGWLIGWLAGWAGCARVSLDFSIFHGFPRMGIPCAFQCFARTHTHTSLSHGCPRRRVREHAIFLKCRTRVTKCGCSSFDVLARTYMYSSCRCLRKTRAPTRLFSECTWHFTTRVFSVCLCFARTYKNTHAHGFLHWVLRKRVRLQTNMFDFGSCFPCFRSFSRTHIQ